MQRSKEDEDLPTFREIGKALGISAATAYRDYVSAMKKLKAFAGLRELLKEEPEEQPDVDILKLIGEWKPWLADLRAWMPPTQKRRKNWNRA